MGDWSYAYDAMGNLTRQTDARSQTTCLYYDSLHRLKGKNYRTDTSCPSDPGSYTTAYSYDSFDGIYQFGYGLRTGMSDASGSTAWMYDPRGRVTQETKAINNPGGGTFVTQWSYNSADAVATMKYPGGNASQPGEQVTTSYHPQLAVNSVIGSNTYTQNTRYDAAGRVELYYLGTDQVRLDYTYFSWATVNGQGRLKRIIAGTPADTDSLLDLRYYTGSNTPEYDATGNLSHIYQYINNILEQTQSFEYDALNRLTSAQASGGTDGTYGPDGVSYSTTTGNMSSKAGVNYTYGSQVHGVRRVNGSGGTTKTITVRAKSTNCGVGTPYATMELRVNGTTVQTWTNVASSWTDYNKTTTLSGNDQIDVVFTNDCSGGGYDRNLFVDYVIVDGRTIQAETGAAIIDKWADDGLDVIAGQEGLYWNAALRFVVGTKAYAAGYDQNGNMTSRVVDGAAFLLSYDAENQLTGVTGNGSASYSYAYDGDGNRVQETAYKNLAAGVPATSGGTLNWPGVITNEDKWANSGLSDSGEFAYTNETGLQYVKLDLGAVYSVDKVIVWHFAADGRTYHSTKTQVSEDGGTWYTVYDSAVSGEYPETSAGKTITFTAQNVRYVRDYLSGSTVNSSNHWVEIEVWGSATTAYVGNYYEWTGSTSTMVKYYYAGSSRVAMRVGSSTLRWLLSDHLGSTTVVADSSGVLVSKILYKAWGELRYASGTTLTTHRYTGQQQSAGMGGADGLYFYQSRWVDPLISHFIQPDSIIPDPNNPLDWNRYAYARFNPVNNIDPTGHKACSSDGDSFDTCTDPLSTPISELAEVFGISFDGSWSESNQGSVLAAVALVGIEFGKQLGLDPASAFRKVYGLSKNQYFKFGWGSCPDCNGAGGYTYSSTLIRFQTLWTNNPDRRVPNVIHELGHAFNNLFWHRLSNGVNVRLPEYLLGFAQTTIPGFPDRDISDPNYGYGGPFGFWQQSTQTTTSEEFADNFVGWTYNYWDPGIAGEMRANWMNKFMSVAIDIASRR